MSHHPLRPRVPWRAITLACGVAWTAAMSPFTATALGCNAPAAQGGAAGGTGGVATGNAAFSAFGGVGTNAFGLAQLQSAMQQQSLAQQAYQRQAMQQRQAYVRQVAIAQQRAYAEKMKLREQRKAKSVAAALARQDARESRLANVDSAGVSPEHQAAVRSFWEGRAAARRERTFLNTNLATERSLARL